MRTCACGFHGFIELAGGVEVCGRCKAEAPPKDPAAVSLGRRGGLKGGKSTSEAKQRASRENGRKNLPKKAAEEAS